jgi:hypothetical protein
VLRDLPLLGIGLADGMVGVDGWVWLVKWDKEQPSGVDHFSVFFNLLLVECLLGREVCFQNLLF